MRFGIPHTTALARLAIATISLCLLVNACGEPSTSGVTATEPVGDAQPAEAEPEPEPEPEEPRAGVALEPDEPPPWRNIDPPEHPAIPFNAEFEALATAETACVEFIVEEGSYHVDFEELEFEELERLPVREQELIFILEQLGYSVLTAGNGECDLTVAVELAGTRFPTEYVITERGAASLEGNPVGDVVTCYNGEAVTGSLTLGLADGTEWRWEVDRRSEQLEISVCLPPDFRDVGVEFAWGEALDNALDDILALPWPERPDHHGPHSLAVIGFLTTGGDAPDPDSPVARLFEEGYAPWEVGYWARDLDDRALENVLFHRHILSNLGPAPWTDERQLITAVDFSLIAVERAAYAPRAGLNQYIPPLLATLAQLEEIEGVTEESVHQVWDAVRAITGLDFSGISEPADFERAWSWYEGA